MDEEMNLKIIFCPKSWINEHKDSIDINDYEQELLDTLERGKPCIIGNDNYPEILVLAVFPDTKEVSFSDDIYPNSVEMATLLKDIEGVSREVKVEFEGYKFSMSIKEAIVQILKLLIPQYMYYIEGGETL